ncbi:putative O-methyltransferase YrrM [Natranaerovirga hydrolytica]|uniref:tRNA 5-hydroxyuridine methyltransferase n=1 Tax=Natranaerovirga hydrolytica TaxID=680378 RepID=A0A4R1N2Z2_9FIRM|nr:O-methyltransferase [Natranaerovirga hydrolytica]TCK98384.1 putative O-methyltransferase YrrM [Natranaerovirga hydrolytica]
MITDGQILDYLSAIEPDRSNILETIENEAIKLDIPIIKKDVQGLLRFILGIHKPKKILEIGTAVGFSSVLMSEYASKETSIITIERSPYMINLAKQNIEKANKTNQIQIIEKDAQDALKGLKEQFDFIFLDAAKGQYITFLPYCVKLLKTGGVLISDNVLQDGNVAKSRYSVARRYRTIHTRMREYLWEINHHQLLETTILPIGDGITMSYKKEK